MQDIANYIFGYDLSDNETIEEFSSLFNNKTIAPPNDIGLKWTFPYTGRLNTPGWLGIKLNPIVSECSYFDVSVFNLSDELKQKVKTLAQETINNILAELKESFEFDEISKEEYDEYVNECNKILTVEPSFRMIMTTT